MSQAPTVKEGGKQKLLALEIGRGIAALMVVINHCDQATSYFSTNAAPRLATWGQYGVDFFFVLSGFIIVYTHQADPKGLAAARRYLWKRVLRIYLPYWPLAFVYMLLLLRYQAGPMSERPWSVWATLTLLPMEKGSTLTVAWTLSYEIMFYALFLLNYISTRAFLAAAGVWIVFLLFVVAGVAPQTQGLSLVPVLTNPIVLEFFCGVAAAYAVRRVPDSWRLGLFAAGVALLALAIVTWTGQRVVLAPPLALIVLAGAKTRIDGRSRFMRAAILVGAASYAIYLAHSPVVSIVARVLEPLHMRWAVFAICFVLGSAAGVVYHVWFERPLMTRARAALRSAGQL